MSDIGPTLLDQVRAMVEQHERRIAILETQEKTTYTPPYNDSGVIKVGQVRCQDIIPPLGDFGVCNGQFECGATSDYPVAQEWNDIGGAGTTFERVAGGVAGNWCAKITDVAGTTAIILSEKLIPVYESMEYYLACYAKDGGDGAWLNFGVACYDAAGTYLGISLVYNAAPGAAWVRIQKRIGPLGDGVFQANTRYIQVIAYVAGAPRTIYLDDVQFQQMKAAYSPGISLVNQYVYDATDRTNNTTNYVQHAGSVMTLTLQEPGYIWFFYNTSWVTNTTRTLVGYLRVYVDAVQSSFGAFLGAAANEYHSAHIGGRWQALLAAGVHTVSLYFRVQTAGDVLTIADLAGSCFYTRAY